MAVLRDIIVSLKVYHQPAWTWLPYDSNPLTLLSCFLVLGCRVTCSKWFWTSLIVVRACKRKTTATISIKTMDNYDKKEKSNRLSLSLLSSPCIPPALITGLQRVYWQVNILSAHISAWCSQGLCWHALSHHPPSILCAGWSAGTVQRYSARLSGLFPPLNQVEIDNRFSPSHWIRGKGIVKELFAFQMRNWQCSASKPGHMAI